MRRAAISRPAPLGQLLLGRWSGRRALRQVIATVTEQERELGSEPIRDVQGLSFLEDREKRLRLVRLATVSGESFEEGSLSGEALRAPIDVPPGFGEMLDHP